MKNKPYNRKPGDIEIRILKNGSIVALTPDEKFIEIMNHINNSEELETEKNENAAAK